MLLSPCQNEATCEALGSYPCDDEHRVTNFSSDYTCGCQPGWVGTTCSDDYDECQSSPCTSPLVCTDKVNGYTCACPDGEHCNDVTVTRMEPWMIALISLAVLIVIGLIICGILRWTICRSKKKDALVSKDTVSVDGMDNKGVEEAEEDQLPEEDIIDLNSIEDRTDVDMLSQAGVDLGMTGESNDWDPDWKPERRHQMSTFSPLLGLTELKPTAPETKILPVLNPDYPSHSPAPWNRHKAGKVSTPWTKSTSSSPAPWNKPKSKKDSQLFKKPNSTSPAPWNKQKLKKGSLLPSVKMPQKDKHGVLSVEDLETKPNQVVGHLDPNWKQHETSLTTDQHNEGYQSDDSIKCEIHENCSNVSSVVLLGPNLHTEFLNMKMEWRTQKISHTVSIQILIPKCCECPDE